MKEPIQEISSKDTCIRHIARLFKMNKKFPELFKSGNFNLDYGGGKYDDVTELLKLSGVTNLVFDPYNRSSEENLNVQSHFVFNSGADTCTVSNVLNVIKEEEFRRRVLVNAKNMMKKGAKIYISIHDGNRSGVGNKTTKGWQENRATKTYLDEVKKIFTNVTIINDIIVGEK